jgi:hypothetical protein
MASTIIIGVGVASHPISASGNTWAFLQWVLGFRELGWNVHVVEHLRSDKCVDPHWKTCAPEQSANLAYWHEMTAAFGIQEQSTLFVDGKPFVGTFPALDLAEQTDLFLNISGHFPMEILPLRRATKIYLDLDPAFTQIWAEVYKSDMRFGGHDRFFSVGTLLGRPGTVAPTCGLEWLPTLPPVVLSRWPFASGTGTDAEGRLRFTTVAHWHGYSWCEWNGHWFKGKSDEFTGFVTLPPRVQGGTFEIATDVEAHADELAPFTENGWNLLNAAAITGELSRHENFVSQSGAEFSAAKGGYVTSKAGWFSDRSVCYLASGRPVVLQDTGIGALLPTGSGLHLVRSVEDAAAACQRVVDHYEEERRAARALAEQHLASDRVIRAMLDKL